MTDEILFRRYLRAKRKLEKKLDDIDRKLDHIIFRMQEEDPRIPSVTKNQDEDFFL